MYHGASRGLSQNPGAGNPAVQGAASVMGQSASHSPARSPGAHSGGEQPEPTDGTCI